MGFPGSSAGKESAYKAGDLTLIPRLGRSPGEGNGQPLQYPGLENPRAEEAGGSRGDLQPGVYRRWGHKELDMTEQLSQWF